ncbi:MAG TPA: hypothetical protein VKT32_12115 [Chthonomonadaceae bacterium]|nr:hypothetical protein [Chthonomonadaceae bacterium]
MPEGIDNLEQPSSLDAGQKNDIRRIVNQWEDQDEGEQEEVVRKLRQMGDSSAEELMVLLKQAYRERKKWMRRVLILAGLYGLLVLLTLLLAIFRIPGHKPIFQVLKYIQWILIPGLCGYLPLVFSRVSSRHNAAVQLLSRLDDVRAVGPLLQIWKQMDWTYFPQRKLAEEPLIRLLPRLRADDASLMDDAQRRCLYYVLLRTNSPELDLALLKALEQVGNRRALPYVRKLAAGRGRCTDSLVREAANECLPYLIERMEEQRQGQTLLRPGSQGAADDALLRPTSQVVAVDQNGLLRPTECSDTPE